MESDKGKLRILVTGGAGFIGCNFIRYMLAKCKDCNITNLDKLTYAGNPANIEEFELNPRYRFVKGDVCDKGLVPKLVSEVDVVVNFAAESHVDRSIADPSAFINTDILGAYNILEAVRTFNKRMVQISTDEVYGSVANGSSKEDDPFNPSSPYSSSKAGADLLALSYFKTFGVDVVVTRSSNNFGPYQYPEKLIPLFVTNAIEDKSLPIYGDGMQMRDWLYVMDNCEAIDFVLHHGKAGEAYNIGGGNELTNIHITDTILKLLNKPSSLIQHVLDRPGHDKRYSLDSRKIQSLGWSPKTDFDTAMKLTVVWYKDHPDWWKPLKSGQFKDFYKAHYSRLGMK